MIDRTITLEDAITRIQALEETKARQAREKDNEVNQLRQLLLQSEVKWEQEKDRADKELNSVNVINQEKQQLQQQINELQSAAGNMASTAESVHKWLEERTRTAKRECRDEKQRADQA